MALYISPVAHFLTSQIEWLNYINIDVPTDYERLLLLIMKISRTTWPLKLSNYTQYKKYVRLLEYLPDRKVSWYHRSSDSEILGSIHCDDNGETEQIANVSLGKSRALIFEIINYTGLTSWNSFYVIFF